MPDLDAHIHAFQDDRTERASLDRINQAKEHWRAYVQGRAESELIRNKLAIEQAVLLSKWRAEDRVLRSSRARPVVCVDCGARDLAHFYTSEVGRATLCPGRFQSRATRGLARERAGLHMGQRLLVETALDAAYTTWAKVIVLVNGPSKVGQWVTKQRNFYDDYRRALVDLPTRLKFIGMMTDRDDARERAVAYFRELCLESQ